MRIPIVFSTDHNFIVQTGVCLFSLLESAGSAKYEVFLIISNDVTLEDRENIDKIFLQFDDHNITYLKPEGEFTGCYETRGVSVMTYYRLLIPWLLPNYDKIIYSDVDVVFCTSLTDVYDINLENNFVGAIPAIKFRESNKGERHCRKIKISSSGYCNPGFLLINSKLQRNNNLREQILKLSNKKFTYQDQDIINILFQGKIKELPNRLCILPEFYELFLKKSKLLNKYYGSHEAILKFVANKNCIVHYGKRPKPWNGFNYGYNLWWDTYKKTPFYDPYYEISHYKNTLTKNLPWKQLLKSMAKKLFN